LRGAAEPGRIAPYRSYWIRLGQLGRLFRLARQEGCRDLVFIGTVLRPAITQLRPDFGALCLLPRLLPLFRGGDNRLLSGLAGIFEERGFRVMGADEIAPQILMPEGPIGSIQPRERDHVDVARGLAFLDAIGPFDIGQAVVVANQRILSVEAAE